MRLLEFESGGHPDGSSANRDATQTGSIPQRVATVRLGRSCVAGLLTAENERRMNLSIRPALLLIAAATASSTAPAQVTAATEPLIVDSSGAIPVRVEPQPIPASYELSTGQQADPLSPIDNLTTAPVVRDEPADTNADAEPVTVSPRAALEAKVAQLRSSDPGSRQLECLAVGIYFEAKSEPLAGQLAVGQVIANRAKSGRFAPTYCGVLFQRSQFSFVRKGGYPYIARGGRQWQNAVAVARIVDGGLHTSTIPNALYFHASRVSPGWRMTRLGRVGNHVFYR